MSSAVKALAIAFIVFTLPIDAAIGYTPPNRGGPNSSQGTGTRLYSLFLSFYDS
ncbi:hypothetical protein ACN4EK_30730 [Pantanalinema rosaneae CENA516]|uniref:hypothetical protein n=1 Tax=Pantanalinema rosaneae TaxID=1620701 RepID=UPI003D6EC1EA